MEYHDLINSVDKLRLKEALHLLHNLTFHLIITLLLRLGRAESQIFRVDDTLRTGIRGHNQNGILKAHFSALRIRDMAIVEHLQQNIEHVWMCLLNLIKQHDRVRRSAHLLAELPAFLKAYIPRR